MNSAGAVATLAGARQIFNYDAYGNAVGFNLNAAATTLLYNGQQTDAATGLQYLRARYYQANTGTFTSLDPYAGNPSSPQSYNKYLYTQGDPVNGFDPTGTELADVMAAMNIQVSMVAQVASAALNTYSILSNVVGAFQNYSAAQAAFYDGDFWGGTAYIALSIANVGLAALSIFGLAKALTPPPPAMLGGGMVVSGAGAIALPRAIWATIELSPAFVGWIMTTFVPGLIAVQGNLLLMSASSALAGLPIQTHHLASNKNTEYTPQYEEIAKKYGLDLDGDWNKVRIPHRGRHPWEYLEFVLDNMKKADAAAGGNVAKFLDLFDQYVTQPVLAHPEMCRTSYWRP